MEVRPLLVVMVLAGCVAPTPQLPDTDPYVPEFREGYGWIEAPSLPVALAGSACTLFEDDVWLFGGIDGTGFVTGRSIRFSSSGDGRGSWANVASMPSAVHGATAAPVSDRIQILGGYEANGRLAVSDDVVEYIPRSGFYNVAPIGGLPGPLAEAMFLYFEGRPSVAGGTQDGINANDRILTWNPIIANAGWHEIDQRLVNARAAGAFGQSPEGFFAAAGGWAVDGNPLQEAEIINWDNGGTIEMDGVPTPRHDASVGSWGNSIVVLGGFETGMPSSTVELMDLTNKVWVQILDLPRPLARSCVMELEDGLHVMGGVGPDGGAVTDHWILQRIE